MSKELEALKNIKIRCHSKCMKYDPIDFDLEIIEQALNEFDSLQDYLDVTDNSSWTFINKSGVEVTVITKKNYDILEQALQRLEAIENANTNEAIKNLEILYDEIHPIDNIGILDIHFNTIKQALITKSKKEQAFDYLIKHFNIECGVDSMPNGEVWARFVHIQSKDDEGTWDTTATANLVDYEEEFNFLKEMIKCLKN